MTEMLQQAMKYDVQDLIGLYGRSGLPEHAAHSQARLLRRCLEVSREQQDSFSSGALDVFFVPGRIEVLGKHTDYAGGRSLVCAVDRGFCFVARKRTDRMIRITDAISSEQFTIDSENAPAFSAKNWENYPLTVVRRARLNFGDLLQGADIVFASDLPAASGMSSSSALMIGIFFCLSAVSHLPASDKYRENINDLESLAMYLACIENGQSFGSLVGERGVGTFGGSEDHIAILCGRHSSLVQYSYAPVAHERTIVFPSEYVFVVSYSGVKANKIEEETRLKYNRKSLLASHLAQMWRESTGGSEPHLAGILKSRPDAQARLVQIIESSSENGYEREELLVRMNHFIAENQEIVPKAGDALQSGDVSGFQALVDKSQNLAESLLQNQVPETIHLAHSARNLGATAASCFGAGFGGSVWAMVEAAQAQQFLESWREGYAKTYPEAAKAAQFLVCAPGPAASRIRMGDK